MEITKGVRLHFIQSENLKQQKRVVVQRLCPEEQ